MHRELFHQSVSDAHGHPTLLLPGYQLRHNHLTRIKHAVVAHDFHLARKGVDIEFDQASGGCVGRHPSIAALGRGEIDLAAFDEIIATGGDRKSTRLNSSHVAISYA